MDPLCRWGSSLSLSTPPPAVSLDSLFFFRGLRDTPTKRSQAHSLWDLMNHVIAGLAGLHASGNRDCMLQPACIGWPGGTLSLCGGWCQPDMPPRKKRKSATDGMSPAEQLESGVERGLIMVLDADTQSAELSEYWPGHPSSCEVVVCGPNGHPKYIRNITDRLETLGFVMGRLPHRPKRPRQPPARVEAQDERRQAETKLTADQLARIEQNRLRALEIRAQRAVERSTLANDVRGSLAVV